MKGIFMEVLKCFGIKMVSFGGNMSCLFLSVPQFGEESPRKAFLAFYAIVVARNKMVTMCNLRLCCFPSNKP